MKKYLEHNFVNNLVVKVDRITGEEFNIHYPGKTIIFAGCSFTAGDGLGNSDTWAYKIQQKFIDNGVPIDGYRNIGVSGFSIYDILDQVLNYLIEYGNPEAIFIMLPEPNRDDKYTNGSLLGSVAIIDRTYKYLHNYCKQNNIVLVTTTWYKKINNIEQEFKFRKNVPSKIKSIFFNNDNNPELWNNQLEYNTTNFISEILDKYDSFYDYSESEMIDFIINNNFSLENNKMLVAADGKHPGIVFHNFWANYMYERYQDAYSRN